MEDLSQQIQNILSDPQAMGQIQGLLSSLNSGSGASEAAAPEPPTAAPAPSGPDLPAPLGALAGSQQPREPGTRETAAGLLHALLESAGLLWD